MKKLLLLLSAVALAIAAETSVSGKWQVHSNIAGTESDSTCTFTQKDAELTGTCASDEGGEHRLTGKVDGKKITWSYKSEYQGTPLTVNYQGTLGSDNRITGTANVPEFSVDGDFTAAQAK